MPDNTCKSCNNNTGVKLVTVDMEQLEMFLKHLGLETSLEGVNMTLIPVYYRGVYKASIMVQLPSDEAPVTFDLFQF